MATPPVELLRRTVEADRSLGTSINFDGTFRCELRDCLREGWTATASDGKRAVARCAGGDCSKYGWSLHFEDANPVECQCAFQDCARHGAECR